MERIVIQADTLTAIADAIRSKSGTVGLIKVSDFADLITAIPQQGGDSGVGFTENQINMLEELLNDGVYTIPDAKTKISNFIASLRNMKPTEVKLSSISATKTKVSYNVGDIFGTSDIVTTAHYNDGSTKTVTGIIDDSAKDMTKAGTFPITVTYTEDTITVSTTITIEVKENAQPQPSGGTVILEEPDEKQYQASLGTNFGTSINTVAGKSYRYEFDIECDSIGANQGAGEIRDYLTTNYMRITLTSVGQKEHVDSVVVNGATRSRKLFTAKSFDGYVTISNLKITEFDS